MPNPNFIKGGGLKATHTIQHDFAGNLLTEDITIPSIDSSKSIITSVTQSQPDTADDRQWAEVYILNDTTLRFERTASAGTQSHNMTIQIAEFN